MTSPTRLLWSLALLSALVIPSHLIHAATKMPQLPIPITIPKIMLPVAISAPPKNILATESIITNLIKNILTDLPCPSISSHATTTGTNASSTNSSGSSASTSTIPTLTFANDGSGNWKYSGFNDGELYTSFVTSDGRGISGEIADPVDYGIPVNIPIEALEADTHGQVFTDPCSSTNFTGNDAVDFACQIQAAKAQGFAYMIGQAP